MAKRVAKNFYSLKTKTLARDLLGKILCVRKNTCQGTKILRMRILETEAYLGIKDPACHTFGGRKTPRVNSMYLPGGHLYVYFIYGMHFCANVVSNSGPEAVLIRAGEMISEKDSNEKSCSGPAKLCKHLGIDRSFDGENLHQKDSMIWIEDDGHRFKKSEILCGPRVGIDYAGPAKDWPLRFWVQGHPQVSGRRRPSKPRPLTSKLVKI